MGASSCATKRAPNTFSASRAFAFAPVYTLLYRSLSRSLLLPLARVSACVILFVTLVVFSCGVLSLSVSSLFCRVCNAHRCVSHANHSYKNTPTHHLLTIDPETGCYLVNRKAFGTPKTLDDVGFRRLSALLQWGVAARLIRARMGPLSLARLHVYGRRSRLACKADGARLC